MTTGRPRLLHVGCGRRARVHLAAQRACGDFELAGVCDTDPARAAASARQYGVPAFTDAGEAIRQVVPDVVVLCTPPYDRVPTVEAALEHGCRAVLLEKPTCLGPAELAQLCRLADRALIAVNLQYRWMTHWQRLRSLVADGVLGTLEEIVASTRFGPLQQGEHVLQLALETAAAAAAKPAGWVLAAGAGHELYGDRDSPASLVGIAGLGEARLSFVHGPAAPLVPADEQRPWNALRVRATGSDGHLDVTVNRGWELRTRAGTQRGETEWYRDDLAAQTALYADLALGQRGAARQEFPTAVAAVAAATSLLFAAIASATHGRTEYLTGG